MIAFLESLGSLQLQKLRAVLELLLSCSPGSSGGSAAMSLLGLHRLPVPCSPQVKSCKGRLAGEKAMEAA